MFWRDRNCRHNRPLKLLLPIPPATFQGSSNRIDHRFAHRIRIAKPDFAFGRMHVHIHRRRIEIEKQERNRELTFHEGGVIALAKRGRQQRTFDGATIHENELLRARLPAHPRLPDQSADPDFRRIVFRLFDVEETIDEILPVKITDAIE